MVTRRAGNVGAKSRAALATLIAALAFAAALAGSGSSVYAQTTVDKATAISYPTCSSGGRPLGRVDIN